MRPPRGSTRGEAGEERRAPLLLLPKTAGPAVQLFRVGRRPVCIKSAAQPDALRLSGLLGDEPREWGRLWRVRGLCAGNGGRHVLQVRESGPYGVELSQCDQTKAERNHRQSARAQTDARAKENRENGETGETSGESEDLGERMKRRNKGMISSWTTRWITGMRSPMTWISCTGNRRFSCFLSVCSYSILWFDGFFRN